MRDLPALEDGEDGTAEPDQGAAAHRGRSLRQRLELQARAAVVEQDPSIEVANHDAHRQFRHQGGEPVLLFLDRRLGAPDLLLDVGQQGVTLLGQVVRSTRQFANLGRPLGIDTEVAIGAKHQAQGLGHPQQTLDILLEQGAQQLQADDQGHDGDQAADRQPAVQGDQETGAFLGTEVGPEYPDGQQEGPGHQQTEHDHGKDEACPGVHSSRDLIRTTRSLVEKGLVI